MLYISRHINGEMNVEVYDFTFYLNLSTINAYFILVYFITFETLTEYFAN